MKNAEPVLVVKFRSALDQSVLMELFKADIPLFQGVPGLSQKFYFIEESTGAVGGVYMFENEAVRETFWSSELAGTFPPRYEVIVEGVRVERYEMAIVLNQSQFA